MVDEAGWLPLESIPTDGSIIDVWANGRITHRVKWCQRNGHGLYAWRSESRNFTDDIGTPTNWKKSRPAADFQICEDELPY